MPALIFFVSKDLVFFKHQEEAKALRKRNIKVFSEILDSMPNLQYCTTWSEAQQMLLDNSRFTEDPDLESEFVGWV